MITIRNPETARLARELAERTGETMEDAVARAINECLARLPAPERPREADQERFIAELETIADEIARLPDLDTRPADEIVGYDEHGAFKPW